MARSRRRKPPPARSAATEAAIARHEAARRRWPGVTITIDDCGGRYYFDQEEADRACEFFTEYLIHLKGEVANEAFELLDYQAELLTRVIFGWKRTADGLRRFRKVFFFVPKKNVKSEWCSGTGLYIVHCDGEPGAEVYAVAADREQANIIFGEARDMNEASEDLNARSESLRRCIYVPSTRSKFQVLSSDVKTKHGPNIHALLFDEFHAQPSRELYDTLSKGVAARRQPLIILTSTAWSDPECICAEEYEKARRVLENPAEDETYLPVIFEAQPEDDWTSPETWKKCNPGFGITVKADYLAAECRDAQREPRKQNAFKRLHLNLRTGQHTAWIPIESWDAGKVEKIPEPGSAAAILGLDLSSKIALTAGVVTVVRYDEDDVAPVSIEVTDNAALQDALAQGRASESTPAPKKRLNLNFRLELHPFFWFPAKIVEERSRADNFDYLGAANRGFLRLTHGNEGLIVDYDQVFEDLVDKILPRFPGLREVAIDPWNAPMFGGHLAAAGFTVVEIPQTVAMLSDPAKAFEALLIAGRIRHAGSPVMRWCVGNVGVKEDRKGNIFPIKLHQRRRIDGVSAALNALNRILRSPPPQKSWYEDHRPVMA